MTYQQDQYLEPIIPLIGEDNIIWGADYPHPDCIWPNSRATLDRNLAEISPSGTPQDHQRERDPALPAASVIRADPRRPDPIEPVPSIDSACTERQTLS